MSPSILEKNIQALTHYLREENALLQTFQQGTVLKQSPRKEALMEAYKASYKAFSQDKSASQALPQEVKHRLIEGVKELQIVSEENLKQIRRVLGAYEYYFKTLARLARDQGAPRVEGYSALGRQKARGSFLPALSFNQVT